MKVQSTHRLIRSASPAARALACALASLLANHVALAASGTWITDGSGTWSDSTNWSASTIADASGSTAFFNAVNLSADTTVSLDSARTLSSLMFGDADPSSAAAWLVDNHGDSANILTLGTNPTITVQALGSGKGATISAQLAGSAGLTKAGAGTLTLAGANSFSGTLTVSAGALKVDAGAGGTLTGNALTLGTTTGGRGTFNYDNTIAAGAAAQNMGAFSYGGGFGDQTVQLTRSAEQTVSLTLASMPTGNIGSSVNFVIAGTPAVNGTDSKIVLTGQAAGFLSGTTKDYRFFNGGDFVWYDAGGFVRAINYGTDASTATSGGTAFAGGSGVHQEVTASIVSQAGVTLKTLKIKGASDITVSSGTLSVTSGADTGAAVLKTGGGTATIFGGFSLNIQGAGCIRTDAASDVLIINSGIASAGDKMRLVKSGDGTLILKGTSSWGSGVSGGVSDDYINAGTLELGGAGTMLSSNRMHVANGALLRFNSSAAQAFTNVINGDGGLTVAGSGTLALTGANAFTGQLTVAAGVLKLATLNNASASGPLGNSALAVILGAAGASTGTLQYTGAGTSSTKKFTLAGGGSGTFQIDSAAATLTLAGVIDGAGGLTKTGDGALALASANTYSGDTTVSAGTLKLASPNSNNDAAAFAIASGARVELNFDESGGEVTDTVSKLFLDSIQMPDGIYGATGSGATTIDDTHFAGVGTLTVTAGSGASPYDAWASYYAGLTPPLSNTAADADPDGDGVSNLAEFAFNGDPRIGSDRGKVFVLTTDNDGSKKLILTIAVRAGTPVFSADDSPTASHDGITYTIRGSTTLENSTKVNVLATPVTTGLPAAGTGYEYRSFSLDSSAGLTDKGFLRAQVTQ